MDYNQMFSEMDDIYNRLSEEKTRGEDSRLYNNAIDASRKVLETWKDFKEKAEKDPEYMPTSKELEDVGKELMKASSRLDAFIELKEEKELDKPLTTEEQYRLDAARDISESLKSQIDKWVDFSYEASRGKNAPEKEKSEAEKKAEEIDNKDLSKDTRDISKEIKAAQKGVHNGSSLFDEAQKAYDRSYVSWQRHMGKNGQLSEDDFEKQKKDLQNAKKAIDRYLDYNKNKDLTKHPKTEKRMEAMRKAAKNIEIRLKKVEIEEKKELEAQREKNQKRVKDNKEKLLNGSKFEKISAKASISADVKLNELGKGDSLNRKQKQQARKAIAAKILEERLKQPGSEKARAFLASNPEKYKEAINTIANSKEFKKSFPDSKLTPANCKNLASNTKAITREAKKFNKELAESQQKKAKREAIKQKLVKKVKDVVKPSR